MAVYTSSYNTMLLRKKAQNDIYIQVSRNLGNFALPQDTTGLASLIDENWGEEFGNWWGSPLDYKKGVRQKDLRRFARHLRELKDNDVFLLCFENVLAGEVCHRIWFSEILQKSYGLKIGEYELGSYAVITIKDYEKLTATKTLFEELKKGEDSAKEKGWLSTKDVRTMVGL